MIGLSFAGGGIMGLMPAIVAAELEKRVGRPLWQCCDIVAGTSTGGIIAAAIAMEKPLSKIVDLYVEAGPRIFHRSFWRRVSTCWGLSDPKYSNEALHAELRKLFTPAWLSDARTRLLIPTYNTRAGKNEFWKSWKAKENPSRDWPIVDVLMSTTAAPTYLPDHLGRVDGGLSNNNPEDRVLTECIKAGVMLEDITVISFGTGEAGWQALEDPGDCGPLLLAPHIVRWAMDGSADTARHDVELLAGRRIEVQFQVPGDYVMDGVGERQMLGMAETAWRWIDDHPEEMGEMVAACKPACKTPRNMCNQTGKIRQPGSATS